MNTYVTYKQYVVRLLGQLYRKLVLIKYNYIRKKHIWTTQIIQLASIIFLILVQRGDFISDCIMNYDYCYYNH